MDQRQQIVACARHYIGVRFQHQGRSLAGLDCLGLLFLTAASVGVKLRGQAVRTIDIPDYGRKPDTVLLREKLAMYLQPIPLAEAEMADVVLLNVQGSPQHLAILSDYPSADALGMIHAYASSGKVVEHRYDAVWQRQSYAAYRLPELTH